MPFLLMLLVLALGCGPAEPKVLVRPAAPAAREPATASPWLRVDFTELMTRARLEHKPVFLDFGAEWCEPCQRLQREVFPDPAVATELARFLCLAIDIESTAGKPLATRYRATTIPRLVFLDPDGAPREALTGYLVPADLARELARIARDEGTLGARRREVAADPTNLDKHLALARHLRAFGDRAGLATEQAAMSQLDPEARSLPLRRLLMDEALEPLQARVDVNPLVAFLDGETHPELLYEGWRLVAAAERMWAHKAAGENDPASALTHTTQALAAARKAWPHTPPERVVAEGGELAWNIYERRAELPAELVSFALEAAQAAVAGAEQSAQGLDANLVDTLACLLAANGRKAEALAQAQRALALDPTSEVYRARVAELGSN